MFRVQGRGGFAMIFLVILSSPMNEIKHLGNPNAEEAVGAAAALS